MFGAFLMFVLIILVYTAISDIITVLFRMTGLTEEKARFQVVSLLTNSGFTTNESEIILNSKIRRRIAKATMLFGYAFTVTIVSSVVTIFMSFDGTEIGDAALQIAFVVALSILFYIIRNTKTVKSRFDILIEEIANMVMFGKKSNPIVLLDDYGDLVVAQIELNAVPPILKDTMLKDAVLKSEYEILVMMLKNKEGQAIRVDGDTIVKKGDILVVLGTKKSIRAVFERAE